MAIALELSSLSAKLRKEILKTHTVREKKDAYKQKVVTHYVFQVEKTKLEASGEANGTVYIPLRSWSRYLNKFPASKDEFTPIRISPRITLFTKETDPSGRGRDQDVVVNAAIAELTENHSVFISCFTGFGKTLTSIYIALRFGLKTAIIVHNDTLKGQWKEEILKITGGKAKVQIISGAGTNIDSNADFYVCGIIKASTLDREELLDIGFVIIDEAHICTRTAFTSSLLRFQPLYLLGLSATPDRRDGLHSLLHIYFGKKFIVREETKNFTVIKYKTNYKPDIEYTYVNGRVVPNWTHLINSLAQNSDRSHEIADLALSHPEHKIIIVCDRVESASEIYSYLLEKGESVEKLFGAKKGWDRSKRVLVCSLKKGGVGLNDPDLTMLIVAADTKDIRQCEGRIRTTDNLVYDIVDDYSTLESHWSKRERWYLKRGATVRYQGVVPITSKPRRFLKN